jgi:hypothetical protein
MGAGRRWGAGAWVGAHVASYLAPTAPGPRRLQGAVSSWSTWNRSRASCQIRSRRRGIGRRSIALFFRRFPPPIPSRVLAAQRDPRGRDPMPPLRYGHLFYLMPSYDTKDSLRNRWEAGYRALERSRIGRARPPPSTGGTVKPCGKGVNPQKARSAQNVPRPATIRHFIDHTSHARGRISICPAISFGSDALPL